MGGRPRKLTRPVQDRIVKAIRLGASYAIAAASASITDRTMYAWMAQGREANSGVHFRFYQAIKKAEADAAERALGRLQIAAKNGTWQADAWLLERRYRDDYALNSRVTLAGDASAPVRFTFVIGERDAERD